MSQQPRLTSVMGVARALLATLATDDAVEVLIAEFGWDVAFQALSLLRGAEADAAFGRCWERLVTTSVRRDLSDLSDLSSWAQDAISDATPDAA